MRIAILTALLTTSALSAAESVTPQLFGVRVVNQGLTIDEEQVRAFNWYRGTTLSFFIPTPSGSVIDINDEESTVASAVDDTGADLTQAPPTKEDGMSWQKDPDIGKFPTIAPDGRGALIEVDLPGIPQRAARTIDIEATVMLVVASQQETVISEPTDFAVDSTVTAGPYTFTVKDKGKPDWGDAKLSLELKIDRAVDDIADIALVLPDQSVLKMEERGSSQMSGMGSITSTITYNVDETFEKARLRIKHWSDRQEIPVTIKQTVGLGVDPVQQPAAAEDTPLP